MTPFLKEIYKNLGKPFIKIHHIFAFIGLGLISLHPIFFSILAKTATVFIPVFLTWYDFWVFAGRPALLVLYIALIGVLLRKRIKAWRAIHVLMHVMLLFGFVHAILIGTDFANIFVFVIYSILYAAAVAAFIIKRIQLYKTLKRKIKSD